MTQPPDTHETRRGFLKQTLLAGAIALASGPLLMPAAALAEAHGDPDNDDQMFGIFKSTDMAPLEED